MRHTKVERSNAVYCVGNGKACFYGRDTEIIQAFGPDYSTPISFKAEPVFGDYSEFETKRIANTDTWQNFLYKDGKCVATVTDFAATDRAAVYRRFDSEIELKFKIVFDNVKNAFAVPKQITDSEADCYMGDIREGTLYYVYAFDNSGARGYTTSRTIYSGVVCSGCQTELAEDGINITVKNGYIAFLFSYDHTEAVELMNKLSIADITAEQKRIEKKWHSLCEKHHSRLSKSDERYEELIDDVSTMIIAQQAESGAVIAGYNYHLGYVRDSYGALLGLLSTGCYDEARALLLYFNGVYEKYGTVKNAQSTNGFNAFHIHENDEVEITGYLVIMVSDYVRASGDTAIWKEVAPFMLWCVQQQHKTLKKGMLPFNGDETYIAGGMLPRTVITHGSLEATVLYHTACRRIFEAEEFIGLTARDKEIMLADCNEIEAELMNNFRHGDKLACNNPDFYEAGEEPKMRLGVSFCGHGGKVLCIRNEFGDYVCTDCIGKHDKPLMQGYNTVYYQASAFMMPLFIGTELMDMSLVGEQVHEITDKRISALGTQAISGVGYDLGLMLACENDPANREKIVKAILALRDESGVWSEYYNEGNPAGTQCRPWESGINITAILKYS